MKPWHRFKLFFWIFIHFKVPLINKVRPKLCFLDDETLVIRVPLTKRTKNHWNSLYFGAFAIGADLAGGVHAYYHAITKKKPSSLIFKSFRAEFLKRANSDVYFICLEGKKISTMIDTAHETQSRITKPITIFAYTLTDEKPQLTALFSLELSVKPS